MSKVCTAVVLLCVLSVASVSYSQESGLGYPQNGDPWNMVPQPSGMQFGGDGAAYAGYGGNCVGCGQSPCVHWTQVSWYASWPNDGWPPIHQKNHCRKCATY